MHPAVSDFLAVLDQDIRMFEDVAKNIAILIPELVGEPQKDQWSRSRDQYLFRAKELRGIAEKVKQADWAR